MKIHLLLEAIDRADMRRILTHFGVARMERSDDADYALYFSPWHKGGGKALRVSKGHRVGGLYASAEWQVPSSSITGYGAISLTAKLMGISNTDGYNRMKIVRTISEICGIDMPALSEDSVNGYEELVNPQREVSVETMDGFSIEALETLGCKAERLYKEKNGKRKPLKDKDGEPVFRFSFGPGFGKRGQNESNFNLERLHREFGLYEVKSYITKSFWQDNIEVSKKRVSHVFFPIFALRRKAEGESGKPCEWGEIRQPEWSLSEGKGCECSRFLYYTGGLNAYTVNAKLMGDAVTESMMGGMLASDAVKEAGSGEHLVTTRMRTIVQEDGTPEEVEQEISPEEVRTTNLLLVNDSLDAISAYYHLNAIALSHPYNADVKDLFYHVAWIADGTTNFNGYMYSLLNRVASNLFLMFDCDNFGKKSSFKICKRFNRIRMAFLPERLREDFSIYMGHSLQPCKDIYSFFRCYDMTEEEELSYEGDLNLFFLSFLTASLPIEPLVYCEKRDKKTNKLLEYYYKVDSACLWKFMATEGYCREVNKESIDKIGRYIHLDGCFVQELDVKSVLAATGSALTSFAKRLARPGSDDFRKMSNAIINSREIVEKSAVNLPEMDVDYRSGYGPELDHFFYRNGALRITPTDITFIPYNQIGFCVDRAEILPFDFQMPCARGEEPFTITENPEYRKKLELLEQHRRDVRNYSQEAIRAEEEELNIWAQRNQWIFSFRKQEVRDWWQPLQVIRCFANEEYEKEEELIREGKTFDEEQQKMLYARMANIIYSLGRPLFRYKGGGTNYIPYVTENSVTKENRAEGGSGKSTFVNVFMGCSGRIFRVNGRNLKPDSDITLSLANFVLHGDRVIHWEDWEKNLVLDPLFNYSTSGFEYRKRHRDEVRVLLKDSPGMVISSNYQPSYDDSSASGRVVPTGFSHRFNRGNVRKNKPEQKISSVMPGLRDNAEDIEIGLRSQIAYINALAVQFCMKARARVLPPMEDLNVRSRVVAFGQTFVSWAEEFFSHDYVFNCPIDFKTIFDEYIELCGTSEDKRNKFASATFRNKIDEYCSDMGYVCNPDVCYSSKTDRMKKYMRVKAWIRKVYFDDEKIWGRGRMKEVRVLEQSNQCVFFCKKNEVPQSLSQVKELCKRYYMQPDPAPILDPETGKPVVITEEEMDEWNIYQYKQQGKYADANKIAAKRSVSADAAAAADASKPKSGEAEIKEELPF